MSVPIEPLAAAAWAAACLALAAGCYQLYFFARRRERREALWAGLISLSAAGYAACQAVTYDAGSDEVARAAVALSFASMAMLVHGVPAFAGALVRRPLPGYRVVGPLSVGLSTLLLGGTELVVAPHVEPIDLAWLGHPYPQPAPAVLTLPFFAYCAAVAALGIGWLARWRARGRAPDGLLVGGLALWVAAGVVDSLTAVGLVSSAPAFFAEHGVLAFVLALVARNVRDHVDALRKGEAALAASEASFRQLIERSPDMIVVHRDGAIVYASPAAAAGLGRASAAELVGTPVLEVVHPDDRAAARDRDRARGRPLGGEQRLLRAGGEAFPAEVQSLPVTFEEEPATLVIARDLTERRKLEARMMQLDRMVSVGTLAAGVAHEVNNPLTFVMGNLDASLADLTALEASTRAPEALAAVRLSLDDAREGAARIRDIVADLSFLARTPLRERRPFRLSEAVDTALKLARHETKPRALLVRSDSPAAPVAGDSARLCQVALNLVVNAAQSIPVGAPDAEIRVSTGMRDGRVMLEVADDGAGIPDHLLGRLFEPFVTTKAPGEGTGLGLAICRRIVADHGGEIEVESEVGRGSTFRVLLPPAPEDLAPEPREPPPSSAEPHRRGRVLVVDEEPMIRRLVERILGAEHEVRSVASAAEALGLLGASADFDAVLCDVPTLEEGASAFLEALSSGWPELAARVLLLTGGARGDEALVWPSRSELPSLRKPFDARALRRIVRLVVEGQRSGSASGSGGRS